MNTEANLTNGVETPTPVQSVPSPIIGSPYWDQVCNKTVGAIANLVNARAGRPRPQVVSKKALHNQMKLIISELEEATKAIDNSDLDGYRDAICDIVLLAAGGGSVVQVPFDEDYRVMTAYNLTRIDTTRAGAEQTIEKYKALGIEANIYETTVDGVDLYPCRTIDELQEDIDGNSYTPNKFLKSYLYQEPVYSTLPGVVIVD